MDHCLTIITPACIEYNHQTSISTPFEIYVGTSWGSSFFIRISLDYDWLTFWVATIVYGSSKVRDFLIFTG